MIGRLWKVANTSFLINSFSIVAPLNSIQGLPFLDVTYTGISHNGILSILVIQYFRSEKRRGFNKIIEGIMDDIRVY